MQNIKVEFENDEGRKLVGVLDLPKTPVADYALFAHCFTCTHNLKAATNISRSLAEAGIAVLRFDFTGLGRSEGEFADTNFSSNVGDLLAAARFLEEEYAAPTILLGHSLGGTAVLQAASSIPSAVAVATIGSPADPAHVTHLFGDARDELDTRGQADVSIGGRPFTVKKQFLDDLEQHDLYSAVGSLRKALLIMHAPLDDIVEIDNAAALYEAAKHPKSFASLDKADHLLSNNADSLYAGRLLAAWASRYLPERDIRDDSLSAEHGSVVAKTWSDGFYTEVVAGDHAFVADEPAAVGGSNRGPSPYELLSAALATCTTMTLKMYAGFKEIAMDAVTVRVSHRKMHAEACADCEAEDGKIDEFHRELTIEGDLDDAQRQRMLEIADRCPVHQTLHGEVKIRTALR
ncbi:MAG: bifunctional alpha/beta hydrolase/OsmC family protein [Woeseiaceae bacterium]|nr:bifunctional alpha/beta hydrolase/OsmC family protein [Woeseiaceae bacterium]